MSLKSGSSKRYLATDVDLYKLTFSDRGIPAKTYNLLGHRKRKQNRNSDLGNIDISRISAPS